MANMQLKSTIKYPTSIIVNAVSELGLQIAEALLEQGGYVVLVDVNNETNRDRVLDKFGEKSLISFLDYSAIPYLEEDIRRLDYVFYLSHESDDFYSEVSTQDFLKYSNYLDNILNLSVKFSAKFLLSTSMSAHQLQLSQQDLDVNFGKDSKQKHAVYTDMEIQRYAESLVLEYVENTNLDARITRLGELIGEQMDFSKDTTFNNLVLQAVRAEDLSLPGDGLDADWYVHIQDAAYGIIKAQFSKETSGQIYSIAYEDSVTHLSLAYKLQELEPDAAEIAFTSKDDGLPPLRLHKPATNLKEIGWKPRAQFEEALRQALLEAKKYEHSRQREVEQGDANNSLNQKLQSFLNLAGNDQSSAQEQADTDSGPVSRLIAERKRQEEERNISLQQAESVYRRRRNQRNLNKSQKLQNFIWKLFQGLQARFAFLQKVTPAQFVVYSTVFLVLIYLYFAAFAPMVVLLRNGVIIWNAGQQLEVAANNYDVERVHDNASRLSQAFSENSQVLSGFTSVASTLAIDEYLDDLIEVNNTYAEYSDGVQKVSYAAKPWQKYTDRFINNVRFRPDSDSYLSVGTSTDYSLILESIIKRRSQAEIGQDQIDNATSKLQNLELALPQEAINVIETYNERLLSKQKQIKFLTSLTQYAPELLGINDAKTYLLLLADNSRPMPIGGSLSASALITVQNGSVSAIELQSIDSISANLAELPKYAVEEINVHTFTEKEKQDLQMQDLAKIGNINLFNSAALDFWGDAYNRNIDGTAILTTEALGSWLDTLGGIELEGEEFTSSNLLDELDSLQLENETVSRRNDLLAQLFAKSIDATLANYPENHITALQTMAQNANNKSLMLNIDDPEYNSYAQQIGITGTSASEAMHDVYTYFINDNKVISPQRYPAYNQAAKVQIHDDGSIDYEIKVKFPALKQIDEVMVCAPRIANQVQVAGIEDLRVDINEGEQQKCAVADVISETELVFSWDTVVFANEEDNQYNLTLSQSKIPGTQVISDVEINLDAGLSFEEISPQATPVAGKVVFTENLTNDQIINLTVSK